jgi:glycerophosphoryl diester phosphodiesterase
VVNHDEHHGKMEIAETPYRALKKLRLSNGEKIPTLKKYLKQGSKDDAVKLIIELKPAKTKELEDEVVRKTIDMVKKLRMENQCEFISFSLNICREIKRLEPDYMVQYLNGDLSPRQLKDENIDGLDYHYKILTEKQPTWIREAKELGLITNSWTVNDLETYKNLKKQGIGFVTTNIPEQLINFLK